MDSQRRNFAEGSFAFISVFAVRCSVSLNAGDGGQEALAKQFFSSSSLPELLQGENFDHEEFENMLIERAHYAMVTAVLFSKIMQLFNEKNVSWTAFVQILRAMEFVDNWQIDAGHAWNFISVVHGENLYSWYFDVHNFTLLKVKEHKTPEQHKELNFVEPHETINISLAFNPINKFCG